MSTSPSPPSFVDFLTRVLRHSELSLAQLTLWRVIADRVEPCQLQTEEEREAARKMFGAVDAFPPAARHVVAMLKGARIGGTLVWALWLLWRALVADLSRLAPGEVGFGVVVCERIALGRQAIRYIKGAIDSVPAIKSLLESETSDSITLRRPQDGRVVTIEVVAASRGGSAARGKSYFGALLDEACFFRDADTGVVNDVEVFRAISPRVMAGGMIGVVSTAWTESGLLWTLFQSNFGNPTTAIACLCKTLDMRSDAKIRADYAIAVETDPENAAREFDCVPLAAGSGLYFEASTITQAADPSLPLVALPESASVAGVGVDTGLVSDSSAGAATHRREKHFTVAELVELRPAQGAPLQLSHVCATYADLMRRHKITRAMADHHELEPSREYLRPHGMQLVAAPGGNDGKLQVYTLTRTLLNEGRLHIPAGHTRLIRQLREVCSKPLPGGLLKIWSPRRGGHGDLVSALVLSIHQANRATSTRSLAIFSTSSAR